MTTLLRGGTIITGAGQRRADLLLEGEKIAWEGRGPQGINLITTENIDFYFDAHVNE